MFIAKYDSDSRIRYDCGSKNIFLCNGLLLYCFYFLRINAIFSFVGAVLIRGCCLFKSLFYDCNAQLMHYGNCNAEPTIIRRVLRDNLQNNCYWNLDNKPENVK